jgi:hypothetical protein
MGTWTDSRVVETSSSVDFPEQCKHEINYESYLNQILGIVIGADRHGFPLLIFFGKRKHKYSCKF